MNEPSWFDTSNRIWEISAQHEREWVQRNVHKIRCLWLLSFVQDIRNFASVHLGGESSRGMARYTTTMDALGVLQQQPSGGSAGVFDEHEFQRLACLLMICVLIYRAFLGSDDAGADSLRSLESLLARSRGSWEGSVEGLYDTIFRVYLRADEGKSHYVVNMARTLGSLSLEARRGVENCLLYVVRRAGGGAMPDVDVFDDSRPTPDSLLASIHGD